MMCAAASISAGGRGRAPNTPSSATITTASMSTSPKPARSQVARHAPPAPVEQRRGLGPERRGLGARRRPRRAASPPRSRGRRCSGGATGAGRVVPAVPSSGGRRRGSRAPPSPTACTARAVSDARELLLVPEVAVERAVRDARGRDEIVDAGVVVAALDEHVASRREQRVERAVPGRVRRRRRRPAAAARASPGRRRAPAAARRSCGVHVHVGVRSRTACGACTSVMALLDALAPGRRRARPSGGCRRRRACGSGTRAAAG